MPSPGQTREKKLVSMPARVKPPVAAALAVTVAVRDSAQELRSPWCPPLRVAR